VWFKNGKLPKNGKAKLNAVGHWFVKKVIRDICIYTYIYILGSCVPRCCSSLIIETKSRKTQRCDGEEKDEGKRKKEQTQMKMRMFML